MGQEIGVDMGNNKLQIKSLDNISNISSIDIDVRSKKYCSKCLCVLGDERVKDRENNVFCCKECLHDFHLERRQDMDDIMSELF